MPSTPTPPRAPATTCDVGLGETRKAHDEIGVAEETCLTPQTPIQRQGLGKTAIAAPPHSPIQAGSTALVENLNPYTEQQDQPAIAIQGPNDEPPASATPSPLPSLLRYVDNNLSRSKDLHDKPPDPDAKCPMCNTIHHHAFVKSVFLPLSPCDCWVHYRCFIWHVVVNTQNREVCPVCNTLLFNYEGITATTLAIRTNIARPNETWPANQHYRDLDTCQIVRSSYSEYAAECKHIEDVIHRQFFHSLTLTPPYDDRSPDLTKCYYAVMKDLVLHRRIKNGWLEYHTEEGYFLYGMLVGLKMRRCLKEKQTVIVGTEGWTGFLQGMDVLQGRIWQKVREESGDTETAEAKKKDSDTVGVVQAPDLTEL
jgi:hypothetical protein